MRKKIVALCLLALGGCADITQPVAAIGESGEIYRGSVTASLTDGGSFIVSRGDVRCSGNYDAFTTSQTVSFPVICTDGRRGLGTAIRDASGVTGSGTIRMSDGGNWTFVFGPSAAIM
jgi:hypothetical protein